MHSRHRTFLEKNCQGCHGSGKQKGKFRVDELAFGIENLSTAERWQKVLNSHNAGDMPPEDEKQPGNAEKADFLDDLANVMVMARKALSDQRVALTLWRLNRREYRNSLWELLGADINVSELPSDAGTGGFDTVGADLFMSGNPFEQYQALGREALTEALKWRAALGPALGAWRNTSTTRPKPPLPWCRNSSMTRSTPTNAPSSGSRLWRRLRRCRRIMRLWRRSARNPKMTRSSGVPGKRFRGLQTRSGSVFKKPGTPVVGNAVDLAHDALSAAWLPYHQEDAQCASCHRKIDPIGFGLENFDAAGQWRTEDTSQAQDAHAPLCVLFADTPPDLERWQDGFSDSATFKTRWRAYGGVAENTRLSVPEHMHRWWNIQDGVLTGADFLQTPSLGASAQGGG